MTAESTSVRVSENKSHRTFSKIFAVLFVYYWLLQFMQGDSTRIIPAEYIYYLFVVPASLFGIFGLVYVGLTYSRISPVPMVLLAFIALVSVASLARMDTNTILTVGLMAINLIVLFQVRPTISLDLINLLFVAAIVITTLLFFAGFSLYTFVPGLNGHPDLAWRTSAFPSVAAGALFAMAVFIANLTLRTQRHREPMLLISAYMLLLSGNRTAIVAAAACTVFALVQQNGILRTHSARNVLFSAIVGAFVFSVFFSELLLMLPFADSDIIKTLIFRDEGIRGLDTGGGLSTAAVREWIMIQHFAAFRESPLTGIGTFDFAMLNTGRGVLDSSGTGSEAFVTSLLARIGILSLPFFAALFLMRLPMTEDSETFSTCCKISLLFGMITYGSFVNVYDFLFLLLILGIAGCIRQSTVPDPLASQLRTVRQTSG